MRNLTLGVLVLIALFVGLLIAGTANAGQVQSGVASWYGHETCRKGKPCRTANGEHFNPSGHTAAHKSLRFGTKVKVTNPKNGRSVIVRINDRGPFIKGRVLDLSHGSAQTIGMSGTQRVEYVIMN